MTRDEQLQTIRTACIEANPEINEPCTCPKGGRWDGERICDKCGGWEYVPRPIRLADVLLAIESYPDYDEAVHGLLFSGPVDRRWNLHADDLTQQSDDCIAFLADLFQ